MTGPAPDLAPLQAYAAAVIATRAPDLVIGPAHDPYLRRWFVVPRNPWQNVYLHEFLRSDDDRALHDHPWNNRTLVLSGRYFEHLRGGAIRERREGWNGARRAAAAHRVELVPGERAVTLFTTGPVIREWGFWCPQGWRHWRDFTAGEHGELVGRGCD